MTQQRSLSASIGFGLLVGIGLYLLVAVEGWNGPNENSYWSPLLGQLGNALTAILPGLVAGYLACRSGFVVGAIAGASTSIAVSFLSTTVDWPPFWEPKDVTQAFIIEGIAYALAAVITNGVSGIAGVHVARARLPSNFSSSGRDVSAAGADRRRSTNR